MAEEFALPDPDRQLALIHVAADRRAAAAALFALDARLARIVASSREPMLTAIRLAWWRAALAALGAARVPDEPLLRTLADEVIARGVPATTLARIVAGWEALGEGATEDHGERGAALFAAAAAVLGASPDAAVEAAGAGWALADLAFHDSSRARAEKALAAARARLADAPRRWPRRLRPLGMLVALARGDARRGLDVSRAPGGPRRAARMLALRWFGR